MEKLSKEEIIANIQSMKAPKVIEKVVEDSKPHREPTPEVKAVFEQISRVRLGSGLNISLKEEMYKFYKIPGFLPNLEDSLNKPNFVRHILDIHGGHLKSVSEEMKNNKDIVLYAINNNKEHYETLSYASESLRNDPEVVLAAVKANPKSIQYASKELQEFVTQHGVDKLMQPDEPIIVPKVEGVLGKLRGLFNSNDNKNKNKMS